MPKFKVTGVDISPEMLDKAQQFLTEADVFHQVYRSDVKALSFNDNTFDLADANVLEHLPAPLVGLQEMVRVLQPGTPLILVVTRPGLLGSLIQLYWGNGCLAPKVLAEMMTEVGSSKIRFYLFNFGLSCWMSIACVGFKK